MPAERSRQRRPKGTLSVAEEKKLIKSQIINRATQLNGGSTPRSTLLVCPKGEHGFVMWGRGSKVWTKRDDDFGKFYQMCLQDPGAPCHFQFHDRIQTGEALYHDPIMALYLQRLDELEDPVLRLRLPGTSSASESRRLPGDSHGSSQTPADLQMRSSTSQSTPMLDTRRNSQKATVQVSAPRSSTHRNSQKAIVPVLAPQSSTHRSLQKTTVPVSVPSTPLAQRRPMAFPLSSPIRERSSSPMLDYGFVQSSPIRKAPGHMDLHITKAVNVLVYQDGNDPDIRALPLRKSGSEVVLHDHKVVLGELGLELTEPIQHLTKEHVWVDVKWDEAIAVEDQGLLLLKPKGLAILI
ncbi:hypothetical protein F5880DRAFT_1618912 [Lentinula raphanica]|nr:hypothetical protein F5880DRAFT_1618912 [Lentinula raphanica]